MKIVTYNLNGIRARLPRLIAFRQDRDAVEALLAVPDSAVAGRLDIGDRQRFVGAFELLQGDHVRPLPLEPFQQAW